LVCSHIDTHFSRYDHSNGIQLLRTPQDVDEVVIQNAGVLDFSLGTLTVEDGAGDDIKYPERWGIRSSLASTPPNFVSASATCNVATGGTLRVSAAGLTVAAPAAGVNAINFVYNHQSVLEYTLLRPLQRIM
jgi:hypothetical protein